MQICLARRKIFVLLLIFAAIIDFRLPRFVTDYYVMPTPSLLIRHRAFHYY